MRTFWRAFGLAAALLVSSSSFDVSLWARDTQSKRSDQQDSDKRDDGSDRDGGTRIRFGGLTVGAGYSHFSGGYGYPYRPWGYPWYANDLFLYPSYRWLGGFVHPGYYTDFRRGPGMGQVRLHTTEKRAAVFIDGGYAGDAKDLKRIWLQPGAYNIELRHDNEVYSRRIYVLSGKTVHIETEFEPISEVEP